MKPNWIIIFISVAVVMATFSVSVLEGANLAVRENAPLEADRVADTR